MGSVTLINIANGNSRTVPVHEAEALVASGRYRLDTPEEMDEPTAQRVVAEIAHTEDAMQQFARSASPEARAANAAQEAAVEKAKDVLKQANEAMESLRQANETAATAALRHAAVAEQEVKAVQAAIATATSVQQAVVDARRTEVPVGSRVTPPMVHPGEIPPPGTVDDKPDPHPGVTPAPGVVDVKPVPNPVPVKP